MLENKMILGDGQYYDMDCRRTGLNNNILVVGTSGSGKTRSIVSPNILQAIGSYIIVDPKGNLYGKYAGYLKREGYKVRKLNFANPSDPQSCSYNFFEYIRSEQDFLKIGRMLIKSQSSDHIYAGDPFWDDSSQLLLTSIIAYLYKYTAKNCHNLSSVLSLIRACEVTDEMGDEKTPLDYIFEEIGLKEPDSYAFKMYEHFRQAAGRTMKGILITLSSHLALYDTKDLNRLLGHDSTKIHVIGKLPV